MHQPETFYSAGLERVASFTQTLREAKCQLGTWKLNYPLSFYAHAGETLFLIEEFICLCFVSWVSRDTPEEKIVCTYILAILMIKLH